MTMKRLAAVVLALLLSTTT